jgi:hypothetical protein
MQLIKNEGIQGYFSGVTGRVSWLTPRCALALTSYEYLSAHVFNSSK